MIDCVCVCVKCVSRDVTKNDAPAPSQCQNPGGI